MPFILVFQVKLLSCSLSRAVFSMFTTIKIKSKLTKFVYGGCMCVVYTYLCVIIYMPHKAKTGRGYQMSSSITLFYFLELGSFTEPGAELVASKLQ